MIVWSNDDAAAEDDAVAENDAVIEDDVQASLKEKRQRVFSETNLLITLYVGIVLVTAVLMAIASMGYPIF